MQERYIYLPDEVRGTSPITPEGTPLEVWTWNNQLPNGQLKLYAIAYTKNQGYKPTKWGGPKPVLHLQFRSEDGRKRAIEQLANGYRAAEQRKAANKAERAKPHTFKVGDKVYNSWGYDQTNVDFYEVVEVTPSGAWLQPASKVVVEEYRGGSRVAPGSRRNDADRFLARASYGSLVANKHMRGSGAARLYTTPLHETAWGYGH